MSKTRLKLDHKNLVLPEYTEMLRQLIRDEGLREAEVRDAAGIHQVTWWRFMNGRDTTIKSAVSIYTAVCEMLPEIEVPAPVLPIRSRLEYRVARIAQRIADIDEDRLMELTEYMSVQLDKLVLADAKRRLGDISD